MKYLKLIRFENLISMVLIQYLIRYSLIIPTFGQENTIGNIDFCFLVFSMILVAAGAYVINDYFDIQVDKENCNKKVLVGRSIKRRIALILHILFTSLGLILGTYISFKLKYPIIAIILILSAYLLWQYSLHIKRQLFKGNLLVAILSALFVFSLASIELLSKLMHPSTKEVLFILCIYSTFAFNSSLIHQITNDLNTVIGDKKFNIKTLATEWGIAKTKEFVKWLSMTTVFMIISISIYKFNTHLPALIYAFTLLIFPLCILNILTFKASISKDYNRISKLNKFIIFNGIISLFFFMK